MIRGLLERFLRRVAGPIKHVVTDECIAALTFDDGPDPKWTPRVLEILDRHSVRATFFMIGRAALQNPELVRSIAAMGHAIGNHSWDHTALTGLSGGARRRQIRSCRRALAPYGSRLLRPPYGDCDLPTLFDAWLLRYKVVAWSVDMGDWQSGDGAAMAHGLSEHVRPGSIVLVHDAPQPQQPNRQPMITALDSFLAEASARLRFVTIPELLRYRTPSVIL